MKAYELNLDGLVGPTHHYAGLSPGNIASKSNALKTANPQSAALQGLEKMQFLHSIGLKQGLLPPQQRPNLSLLEEMGFSGTPAHKIMQAYRKAPAILSACYSASSMWTANAATVSPSMDTMNNKIHFTAANLVSNIHRHQEAKFSKKILETLFCNPNYFEHHPILPATMATGDEGAANHNRLAQHHGSHGIELFVYGKIALNGKSGPKNYPARQTKEASEAIARKHQLHPEKTLFACQNPEVIDLGVFHNDVIAVANESVFMIHEQALVDQNALLDKLNSRSDFPIQIITINQDAVSVQEAVSSYLFNSQLVTLPDGQSMALIAPIECQRNPRIQFVIDTIVNDPTNPIVFVHYLDLKQSMSNGGGPACLRLRVVVNDDELNAMHQGVLIHDDLITTLKAWVIKHYRTELQLKDLACPQFIDEVYIALDELSSILNLGSIYPFQQI